MYFIDRLSRTGSVSLLASLLTFSFMVQAQNSESVAQAASEQMPSEQASKAKQPAYHFPKWPNRKQVKRDMVPPPPPGPYMSSSLSGNSLKMPSFSKQAKKPKMAFKSPNISMDTFSPDVPWPTNLRPPARWMPENGYQYVQPQAGNNRQQAARQQAAPTNNRYGYRPQGPQMNWSGMRLNPNNSSNNSTNGPGMPMPDMRRSDNRSRGSNGPTNWVPSMGYPANRGQYRPNPGNANPAMTNRGPVRQNTRQGGE